jgi:hypothetical protein
LKDKEAPPKRAEASLFSPADGRLRVFANVSRAHVGQTPVPFATKIVSVAGVVRDRARLDADEVARLAIGTKVTVTELVTGEQVRNNCRRAPFDGCIEQSDVWAAVEWKLPTPGSGLTSLVNLLPPTGASSAEVPVRSVVGTPGTATVLPAATRVVRLRARVAEFFARQAALAGATSLSHCETHDVPVFDTLYGAPKRTVKRHSLCMSPGLDVLAIHPGTVRLAKVTRLRPVFALVPGGAQGADIPVSYELEGLPAPDAIALLSPARATSLRGKALSPAVERRTEQCALKPSGSGTIDVHTSTITVDLDGDSNPDIKTESTGPSHAWECERARGSIKHEGSWVTTDDYDGARMAALPTDRYAEPAWHPAEYDAALREHLSVLGPGAELAVEPHARRPRALIYRGPLERSPLRSRSGRASDDDTSTARQGPARDRRGA